MKLTLVRYVTCHRGRFLLSLGYISSSQVYIIWTQDQWSREVRVYEGGKTSRLGYQLAEGVLFAPFHNFSFLYI